jgi:RNA polymerase sigma factor (sigma-70 family)
LTEESTNHLRELIRRLPDAQREAVLLRYAGGLTTREIAATIGRSEAAVQKLISRTLASLKETYRAIDG